MRGRKPLPAHLHVINGTATSRTVDDVKYTAVEEFPSPPQHLNADGVQIWNDIGRELTACGVLQVVDLYALGQLAYMWQRHMAKAKLGADIISAETMSLRSLFAEFGMTPASRRRFISSENGSGDKAKKNRFKKFKQDR